MRRSRARANSRAEGWVVGFPRFRLWAMGTKKKVKGSNTFEFFFRFSFFRDRKIRHLVDCSRFSVQSTMFCALTQPWCFLSVEIDSVVSAEGRQHSLLLCPYRDSEGVHSPQSALFLTLSADLRWWVSRHETT